MADIELEHTGGRKGNHYSQSIEEVQEMTRMLLAERPPTVGDNFVCYQLDGTDKLSDIGRYIERVVFEKTFGNDAERMEKEYGAYEDDSIFYITIDREAEKPVGVLRVIKQGEAGLKTLNDLTEMMPDLTLEKIYSEHGIVEGDDVWDVGTVAVLPEYRDKKGKGSAASIQLFRALYLDAMNNNVKHMISVIDHKAHDKLTNFLRVPFVPLAGLPPFSYIDSENSRAVYGRVDEFYDKMSTTPKRPLALIQYGLARAARKKLVMGTRDHTIIWDERLSNQ